MNTRDFGVLGQLLARSALLADGRHADAADALLSRAVDHTASLSDRAVAALFGFLSEWVADQMEAGASELAFAAELLRSVPDEPASIRSAIINFVNALATASMCKERH